MSTSKGMSNISEQHIIDTEYEYNRVAGIT